MQSIGCSDTAKLIDDLSVLFWRQSYQLFLHSIGLSYLSFFIVLRWSNIDKLAKKRANMLVSYLSQAHENCSIQHANHRLISFC